MLPSRCVERGVSLCGGDMYYQGSVRDFPGIIHVGSGLTQPLNQRKSRPHVVASSATLAPL